MGAGMSGTTGKRIRVLLVDDYQPLQDLLGRLLSRCSDLEVVGIAATGEEAIEMAVARTADVVVMDTSMPGIGGAEATRRLVKLMPEVRIVGHSAHEFEHVMLSAGAAVFVGKGTPPHLLLDAIRTPTRS
jgi:two-component system invasion response regulator UvrY